MKYGVIYVSSAFLGNLAIMPVQCIHASQESWSLVVTVTPAAFMSATNSAAAPSKPPTADEQSSRRTWVSKQEESQVCIEFGKNSLL